MTSNTMPSTSAVAPPFFGNAIPAPSVTLPKGCTLPHASFTLPNGARIIVAQDVRVTTSAAASTVYAGSWVDPDELPGLAHLCEHMLFLGTEKTPEEGAFRKLIKRHAGGTNAWTGTDMTTYYFTSANGGFLEALAEWLWFFVAPTMTEGALEREVQAVHSECEKYHTHDSWCQEEVACESVRSPLHPSSRFRIGNRATLWDGPRAAAIPVHERLWEFYKQRYVGANFALAIVSNQPVETVMRVVLPVLERMPAGVRTNYTFMSAPAGPSTAGATTIAPGARDSNGEMSTALATDVASPLPIYHPEADGRWVDCVTNASKQYVSICFPLRSTLQQQQNTCSHGFIAHILGHEVTGSLLDVLKHEGLATSTSVGASRVDDHHVSMKVTVMPTAEGLKQLHRVVDLVFEAIQYIADHIGPAEDIYDEITRTSEITFELAQSGSAATHAQRLADGLNRLGFERAWSGGRGRLQRPLDRAAIIQMLQVMRDPRRAHYVLGMPDIADAIADGRFVAAATAAPREVSPASSPLAQAAPLSLAPTIAAAAPTRATRHHKARYGYAQVDPALLDFWARPRYLLSGSEEGTSSADDSCCLANRRATFHVRFAKPRANPYIASDLSVRTAAGEAGLTWAHDDYTPRAVLTSTHGIATWRPDAGLIGSAQASIVLDLCCPIRHRDPYTSLFNRVLAKALQLYVVTDEMYFASVGGYGVSVSCHSDGLRVGIGGPSEKAGAILLELTQKIIRTLGSDAKSPSGRDETPATSKAAAASSSRRPTTTADAGGGKEANDAEGIGEGAGAVCVATAEQYDALARSVKRQYLSARVADASAQGASAGTAVVDPTSWPVEYGLSVITADGAQELPPYAAFCEYARAFASAAGGGLRYRLCVVGNVTAPEALSLANSADAAVVACGAPPCAETALRPKNVDVEVPTRVQLAAACALASSTAAPDTTVHIDADAAPLPLALVVSRLNSNPKDGNCYTRLQFQVGACTDSLDDYVVAQVLGKALSGAIFSSLRTNEALGYSVGGGAASSHGILWLQFSIQSANRTCLYLLSRIYAFLEAFLSQKLLMAPPGGEDSIEPRPSAEASLGTTSDPADVGKKRAALQADLKAAAAAIAESLRSTPKTTGALATNVQVAMESPWGFNAHRRKIAALEAPGAVAVERVQAFVRRVMCDPRTARPQVIFIHGTAASRDEWEAQVGKGEDGSGGDTMPPRSLDDTAPRQDAPTPKGASSSPLSVPVPEPKGDAFTSGDGYATIFPLAAARAARAAAAAPPAAPTSPVVVEAGAGAEVEQGGGNSAPTVAAPWLRRAVAFAPAVRLPAKCDVKKATAEVADAVRHPGAIASSHASHELSLPTFGADSSSGKTQGGTTARPAYHFFTTAAGSGDIEPVAFAVLRRLPDLLLDAPIIQVPRPARVPDL